MKIELKKPNMVHKFEVGDLFKTGYGGYVRMIIMTHDNYHTISLNGEYHSHDTSIGLLMNQYHSAEFIGRLEIKD